MQTLILILIGMGYVQPEAVVVPAVVPGVVQASPIRHKVEKPVVTKTIVKTPKIAPVEQVTPKVEEMVVYSDLPIRTESLPAQEPVQEKKAEEKVDEYKAFFQKGIAQSEYDKFWRNCGNASTCKVPKDVLETMKQYKMYIREGTEEL